MKELLQISNKRPTRKIMVGDVPIGGGSPVSIQTMTTTLTRDVDATLAQVERCAEAGAQIVRVAVPEAPDAKALGALVKRGLCPDSLRYPFQLPIRTRRCRRWRGEGAYQSGEHRE